RVFNGTGPDTMTTLIQYRACLTFPYAGWAPRQSSRPAAPSSSPQAAGRQATSNLPENGSFPSATPWLGLPSGPTMVTATRSMPIVASGLISSRPGSGSHADTPAFLYCLTNEC